MSTLPALAPTVQIVLSIFSGAALASIASVASPDKSRAHSWIAVVIAVVGMMAYWLPFILWSQNIITDRGVATISALAIALAMLIVQSGITRWLAGGRRASVAP